METAEHKPGRPLQCMSIAVEVEKERIIDEHGQTVERTGLRIGGGIDVERTPYCDRGVYITFIEPNSPAERAGLRCHDKILQINGVDFTMVTHDRAVKTIQRASLLNMLIARRELAI